MNKPAIFGDSVRAFMEDPEIGFVLVAVMGGGAPQQMLKWKGVQPMLQHGPKPGALCYMGDDYPLSETFVKEVRASGVPFFRSPERALRALARIAAWSAGLDNAGLEAQSPQGAESLAPRLTFSSTGALPEYIGKDFLKRCGVRVPEGFLARSTSEARTIAGDIGYPVALKAQAGALAHKSDAGGVALGIADEDDLDIQGMLILSAVQVAAPGIALDGLLVEKMAPRGGLEMIVGARRDPQWGAVLLIGLGGIWTEALKDVRLIPAGASAAEIEREAYKLKGAAMLRGMRGAAPRDVAAFANIAARIGAMMTANPEITDIDVNPVNVYAQGDGAMALDALIVTA